MWHSLKPDSTFYKGQRGPGGRLHQAPARGRSKWKASTDLFRSRITLPSPRMMLSKLLATFSVFYAIRLSVEGSKEFTHCVKLALVRPWRKTGHAELIQPGDGHAASLHCGAKEFFAHTKAKGNVYICSNTVTLHQGTVQQSENHFWVG